MAECGDDSRSCRSDRAWTSRLPRGVAGRRSGCRARRCLRRGGNGRARAGDGRVGIVAADDGASSAGHAPPAFTAGHSLSRRSDRMTCQACPASGAEARPPEGICRTSRQATRARQSAQGVRSSGLTRSAPSHSRACAFPAGSRRSSPFRHIRSARRDT